MDCRRACSPGSVTNKDSCPPSAWSYPKGVLGGVRGGEALAEVAGSWWGERQSNDRGCRA
jgi:hypothetical protein